MKAHKVIKWIYPYPKMCTKIKYVEKCINKSVDHINIPYLLKISETSTQSKKEMNAAVLLSIKIILPFSTCNYITVQIKFV